MQKSTWLSLVRETFRLLANLRSRPRFTILCLFVGQPLRGSYLSRYVTAHAQCAEAEARRKQAVADKLMIENFAKLSRAVRESFPNDPQLQRKLLLAKIRPMIPNQSRRQLDEQIRTL